MSQESTFWRVCDNFGICHCDWRYTIYDCEETEIAKILYLVTAIISGILSIVAVMILYFRLNYRNQKIFEIRNGFPRPKPIESMGLFGIIFNVCKKPFTCFFFSQRNNNILTVSSYSANDSCYIHSGGYHSKSCISFM